MTDNLESNKCLRVCVVTDPWETLVGSNAGSLSHQVAYLMFIIDTNQESDQESSTTYLGPEIIRDP